MSGPLHILQLCSARHAKYGAAISMLHLAKALEAKGHRITIGTFTGRQLGDEMRGHGLSVVEFPVRLKLDPLAAIQLSRYCHREQVDVVQAHLSTACVLAGLAGKMGGLRTLSTVHGMSRKASYGLTTRMIAVSEAVRQHLIRQGVSAPQVSTVHNGLPPVEVPDRAQVRAELGLSESDFVVVSVSRLVELKGLQYGIEAMAKLRDELPGLRYLIVGDGPYKSNLEQLVKSLGLEQTVLFTGYSTDIHRPLAAADLFLFPTLKEAMGLVLLEAMQNRLPCVASDVGGIPEVITPETGILVPAKDSDGFAQAIRRVAADAALRRSMGDEGYRRWEQEFTAEHMADESLALYENLLGRGGAVASQSQSRA